jgi:hypothetical protein
MKAIHPASLAKSFLTAFCLLLALASTVSAQTGASVPVVTIQATDPVAIAYQPGNSSPFTPLGKLGLFTVFRHGNTNLTLNVYYQIGGTATNGVDYASISDWVTIPAGAVSNLIRIMPINPMQTNTQTVVLQLASPPTLNPVNFEIGVPSNAVVYIESTNPPPFLPVSIDFPNDGAVFYAPTNIQISASVSEPVFATNVEVFAGTNDLGKAIAGVSAIGFGTSYFLTWTNPLPGNYALMAVATDYFGTSITSAPVNVTVQEGPPPTNLPPIVEIFSPTNGAVFNTPASISLIARAADPDGSVTNVEFFAGTTDLGRGLPVVLDPPGVNGVTGLVYFFNWQNVPPNSYLLAAVATDNGGISTTSAPVNIAVLVPPTNRPPVVRITSPPNGSVFHAPVNIPVYAYAADPDGFVTTVEFFAGSTSLGFGKHVTAVPPPLPPGPVQPPILIVATNFWELTWTNPPPGTKIVLTAEATDNGGLSTTSNPVFVSILPPLPPPTNRPPVVSIVATDPVAIEGTNCWTWPGLVSPAVTWSNWLAAGTAFRLFTNCGPKDATFTVFRFGATNDELNVAYAIGGTATNGADYVALPGGVTIPAGERRAEITIVPLDDGPPDVTSTVVLKLIPDVTGTNYLFGYPRAAAAIILDSQSPQAVTGMMPGASFNLAAAGPDGAWFHVEYSTDLIHWTPICTNQVVNGSMNFVDPDAPTNPARFYRTVPESGPPPQ